MVFVLSSFLFLLVQAFSSSSPSILPSTTTITPITIRPSVRYKERFLSSPLIRYARYQEDDDDYDEDDDDPPDVDIKNFSYSSKSLNGFGLGQGRSPPSQRKAMGTSSKSSTQVYVCTNCGGESAVWRGKCPTCQEWNSFQKFQVPRAERTATGGMGGGLFQMGRPNFASTQSNTGSWLDGVPSTSASYNRYNSPYSSRPVSITDIDLNQQTNQRLLLPMDDEFNQVLGGGLVRGSLLLLGGDPGVGKSTLALQVASQLASLSTPLPGIGMGTPTTTTPRIGPVWYVSGEETLEQIATRAKRLSTDDLPSQLYLLSETNLNVMAEQVVNVWMQYQGVDYEDDDEKNITPTSSTTLPREIPPSLIVVDSIQTMVCEAGGSSSSGGIVQVRECMALLLRLAKTTHIPILTIGHVTKSGDVAGPRMVEHMVDAVLYLEHHTGSSSSSSTSNFRWLRAQKNRFGSCQTVGLYDFQRGLLVPQPEGLQTMHLPSTDLEGCAFSISMEGSQRAITVEVQALVTVASSGFSKKTVEGIPLSRLNLLLGVLQKHCRLRIAGSGGGTSGGKGISRDVYVNVVGGASKSQQTLAAPALDLAVAVALCSSFVSIPVRADTVLLAQVGLLGELRPVPSIEARLQQAQRMGFSRAIVAGGESSNRQEQKKPKWGREGKSANGSATASIDPWRSLRKYDMDVFECTKLGDALELALTASISFAKKRTKGNASSGKGSSAPTKKNAGDTPGSLNDLYLEADIILDDEDDEFDEQY
ncbi:DNA repair protein radA [Nitzschia inconspicua]|uniref:DNA repair protein radA n=1 Tax=Nitzschia inconspicua TaxID=303405 RepID=A0A9K3M7A1_9STRA|nr:DNA repair protein radA [Nitzschia inconspicua]